MLAAAAAWDRLSSELHSTAAGCQSLTSDLAGGPWLGPASVSMLSAVTPFVAWLHTTADQAEEAATRGPGRGVGLRSSACNDGASVSCRRQPSAADVTDGDQSVGAEHPGDRGHRSPLRRDVGPGRRRDVRLRRRLRRRGTGDGVYPASGDRHLPRQLRRGDHRERISADFGVTASIAATRPAGLADIVGRATFGPVVLLADPGNFNRSREFPERAYQNRDVGVGLHRGRGEAGTRWGGHRGRRQCGGCRCPSDSGIRRGCNGVSGVTGTHCRWRTGVVWPGSRSPPPGVVGSAGLVGGGAGRKHCRSRTAGPELDLRPGRRAPRYAAGADRGYGRPRRRAACCCFRSSAQGDATFTPRPMTNQMTTPDQVDSERNNIVREQQPTSDRLRDSMFGSEARLSWLLAGLAGLLGATAFTHSTGYFLTFMTGNSERAVLGFFRDEEWLSTTAALLLTAFVGGVVTASVCRRHLWVAHPHGPTVLTALCLAVAATVDILMRGWSADRVSFVPILFVAFGIGALNTSFVEDGEVSIPLSYVTGTLVKLGQGVERHISGGNAGAWLGYFLLYAAFLSGATVGGCISLVVSGSQMLAVATVVCVLTTAYTYFHADRRALLKAARHEKGEWRSMRKRVSWTAVLPFIALVGLALDVGRRHRAIDRGGDGRAARRCRVGRGPPCRSDRAPGRRALRVTGARGCGDRHRGDPDCHADGVGRGQVGDAGQGHGVCRGDAQHERNCRPVASTRFPTLQCDVVQRAGQRRRAGHRHHAGHAEPGAAHVHHHPPGPTVLARSAGFRRDRLARPLPDVRLHPDRAASRLFSAGHPAG